MHIKSCFQIKRTVKVKLKFVLLKDIGKILIDVEAGEGDVYFTLNKIKRNSEFQIVIFLFLGEDTVGLEGLSPTIKSVCF